MEGAALTLGALMPSVLVKEERFRAALEGLARQYLVPLFASPHAFLRAKGAWLAGQYAQELKFQVAGESEKKRGRGALFDELFDLVLRSMNDPCAPRGVSAVAVSAAAAAAVSTACACLDATPVHAGSFDQSSVQHIILSGLRPPQVVRLSGLTWM